MKFINNLTYGQMTAITGILVLILIIIAIAIIPEDAEIVPVIPQPVIDTNKNISFPVGPSFVILDK